MSQLDTYKVELYLPETDRKILFPVQATEYTDVWAFADNLASEMPEEDVYFDKSDRTARTSWSSSVEKVEEPEPEPENKHFRIQFSTTRHYGPEPQVIRAVRVGKDVFMNDSARSLTYHIRDCDLDPLSIMERYDRGGNDTYSAGEFEFLWIQAEDI